MNIGLGIGIPFTRSQIWLSLFDPSKLFTAGVNGIWLDPSDINLTWRRNLLTYSEQFDNAAWTKAASTVTSTAVVDPLGTLSAETLSVNSGGRVVQAVSGATANTNYTLSVWVKKSNSGGATAVRITTNNTVAYSTGFSQKFTLTSDWVRITTTGAITSGAAINYLIGSLDVVGNIDTDCIGNIDIWGAQLELGSTATPYQRITDGIQDYLQYQPLPVMFQNAAGTTPVTAVEQPVGLMLDKSKGLVLGPNIYVSATSAGATALNANGTVSTSGLQATATCTTAGNYGITFTNVAPAAVGKSYQLKVTIVSQSVSGRVYLDFGGVSGLFIDPPASGVTRIAVNAASTGIPLRAYMLSGAIGNAFTISFEYVSELPGNHAFNSSGNSANFPVLSARYNVLNNTETLATQSVTTRAAKYILSFWGTGSVALSGTYTGTLVGTGADNRVYVEFTATAGTLTLTVTGSVLKAQLEEL